MPINFSRGFWRLWLFFSFIWVIFCGWQLWDAHAQLKKAVALESYYMKASIDARRMEFRSSFSSIVSAHLNEQVEVNRKIIAEQRERDDKFFRLTWLIPLITLFFAWGIPWVYEGFMGRPCGCRCKE